MTALQLLRGMSLPLMAILCMLAASCGDQPTGSVPAGPVTVSGVLNDEAGAIIPGAYVEAFSAANARLAADSSDETGMFELSGLPENLTGVQVRVAHGDFKPFAASIESIVGMAGGTEGVIMQLMHNDSCCARLLLVATDPEGRPLPGVEIKLRRGKNLVSVMTSDSAGLATFMNVCGGEYNVRLAKGGYEVVERDGIAIRGCDTTRREFVMKTQGKGDDSCCNGFLRVIPRDSATNQVITGAQVQIKRQGGSTRTETTNGDGAGFRELCAGTYSVRIAREGKPAYRTVEFTIRIGCNDSSTATRLMIPREQQSDSCCAGKATVIIRDSASGTLLSGATVKLWKGNTLLSTRTAENGRIDYSDLCKGEYVAEVTRQGYKRQEAPFTLECNGRTEVTRRLPAERSDSCCNGRLEVVVRDSASNAPVVNALVKLWKGSTLLASKQTNANGVAVFEGLCAGSYGVNMSREGYTSREFEIGVECNARVETTRKLLKKSDSVCCTAKFVFKTKDSTTSSAIAGAGVRIMRGNTLIAEGQTNGEGRYLREGICGNESYTVTFSKDGYASKTFTFRIAECRVLEETILLMPD